jgi:hypothetical protein
MIHIKNVEDVGKIVEIEFGQNNEEQNNEINTADFYNALKKHLPFSIRTSLDISRYWIKNTYGITESEENPCVSIGVKNSLYKLKIE